MHKILSLAYNFLLSPPVFCEPPNHKNVYQQSINSVFTLYLYDPEGSSVRATCTGFFITDDGLGITSGPIVKSFRGTKIKVVTPDKKEYSGELMYYPSAPGIGFVQIKGRKTQKLAISKEPLVDGQDVFVLGIHDSDAYFSNLMITDMNHPWVEFKNDDLYNTPVIRTTGFVPIECFGAPLLDEDGKVRAVMFNVELGMGICFSLMNLKNIFKENNEWQITKAWRRAREMIVESIYRE